MFIRKKWRRPSLWRGLLDWIIGWICLHPSLGDVVAVASQGRFLFFFVGNLAHKGYILSKKVICGPEFLKNDDIWSDFIKLDLRELRLRMFFMLHQSEHYTNRSGTCHVWKTQQMKVLRHRTTLWISILVGRPASSNDQDAG